MMVIYIKQHLSNIWSSMHEKVKQHFATSSGKIFDMTYPCFSKIKKKQKARTWYGLHQMYAVKLI